VFLVPARLDGYLAPGSSAPVSSCCEWRHTIFAWRVETRFWHVVAWRGFSSTSGPGPTDGLVGEELDSVTIMRLNEDYASVDPRRGFDAALYGDTTSPCEEI
jgi:hypothetical protein